MLAEESGTNAQRSEHRWIVDPLDGTTNFAHGFPQFCVSIAYGHRGQVELAVVYDALKRELFVAARGRAAQRTADPRERDALARPRATRDRLSVACGRVDALWELGPRPWDVAAGALIVTEAGGQVTNLDGSALDLDARKMLASKGKLHRAMRETITKAWPEANRREAESRAAP